jgi:arabinose-5-phosphate isomerase
MTKPGTQSSPLSSRRKVEVMPPDEPELAFAARVLERSAEGIVLAKSLLDGRFTRAVDLVAQCERAGGTVLVTGLGKSGLIGQKISATLASLGITSHFVHPAEAAHGDLGRFRKQDLVIAISYSGETDEVVNLVGMLKPDQIPVIVLAKGLGDSTLERMADCVLAVGDHAEIEVSPAPATTTTATLAVGDALALAAARRLGATSEDFARRHPGGALGNMLRPVMEIVRFTIGKNLVPVADDLRLNEALRMAEYGARRPGALLLVNRETGVLSGIFTDADLRRLILKGAMTNLPMAELMTRDPGTLPDTARVRDAVRMVREFRRDEIPIVDERHRPVGLLDVQDLITMRLVQD